MSLCLCVCERKEFQIHDGEEFNSRNNRTRFYTIPSDLTNDVHDENETESTRATKAATSKTVDFKRAQVRQPEVQSLYKSYAI